MGTTTYDQATADKICERIALGESLRRICLGDDMPNRSTVFKWLDENTLFSDQYGRARVWQAESMMDDILEIADNGADDIETRTTGEGEDAQSYEVTNHEVIQRSKLRVDARLKLMQQLAPKKYGPKMAVTGADGAPLLAPPDLSNLDAKDLRALLDLRRKMKPAEGAANES